MSAQIDEATVRQFIEIINACAAQAINGNGQAGVLQLCRISPLDDASVVPSRFQIGDIEHMVKTAIDDAAAEHNVYIEARTVHDDVRGNRRGGLEDTAWVFGLVIDSDADKGKGGNVTVRPTLATETSPGNFQLWYLFDRAILAAQAKLIGDAIRASSGTDQDTGVITQCYRVAGTPNFPSAAKRARGRVTVEATRIFEHSGHLWNPDELLAQFSTPLFAQQATAPSFDEVTLPDDLLETIRQGGAGKATDRSALFHSVVAQLKRRNWTVDAIIALLEKYPEGIAKKYVKRLRKEVERSYRKIASITGTTATATATGPGPATAPSAAPSAGAAAPYAIPTIRLVDGQLPRTVVETERALIASGAPVFARAGILVEPVSESAVAAGGYKTVSARLRPLCCDSLLKPVAEAAIFQRFNRKRNTWVDIDPPLQLVRMVLAGERGWAFPRVSGVITTPTLRADGSLLATPGYDPRSELYLLPGLQLPTIFKRPTRKQARAALDTLIELLSEFPFKGQIDRSVALAGLLTAAVRGSLATAPVFLVRADTPGTGKSYLVDIIAMITTGRLCPVITALRSVEETEKRIGSVILSGAPIISLDNCVHDLAGELLCQVTERPVVKIRILGRSETPDCECHTAVYATGNNVTFKGDMVRRGLVCNLETLIERPELREFHRDTLEHVAGNRGAYVAAVLTVIRAYLMAGAPRVCGPFGSYTAWSTMVRSPLVWLGEPDPVGSMDAARNEDPELSDIREFFDLWLAYELDLDLPYTTSRIIEVACAAQAPNDYNPRFFEHFLLRVAVGKDGKLSAQRLGMWLRKISGRVVAGHRLVSVRIGNVAAFKMVEAPKPKKV